MGATKRREWVGEGLTALCGGALALNVLLVIALLAILGIHGLDAFRQRDLLLLTLDDGTRLLGELRDRELIPSGSGGAAGATRIRLALGNRDFGTPEFAWIDERRIVARSRPADALLIERVYDGDFHGWMVELWRGDELLARGPEQVLPAFRGLHAAGRAERARVRELEKRRIGDVSRRIERLRLVERSLELESLSEDERARRRQALEAERTEAQAAYEALAAQLFELRHGLEAERVVLESVAGQRKTVPVSQVVRVVPANRLGALGAAGLYLARVWEFLSDEPRESNTEGGIFPAIFGTVLMVFLMSFAVTPLGVLAALYLREYARQGWIVRIVRIAVNNLAGVPSIVFGVFGLGFFVYLVGGTLDRLFYPAALPSPTFGSGGILWASLTLALLTVPVVIVATEEGLAAVPRNVREGSLALGATKFETTWRVILPAAAPGILTGLILAMARAAGEVAPLMIVGMVKLADLPLDHHFPYLHLEAKFMHLGFHVYDLGFQSPNVEAVKPLVFATALLLIVVVTVMNLTAISVRNYLRRRYASSAV